MFNRFRKLLKNLGEICSLNFNEILSRLEIIKRIEHDTQSKIITFYKNSKNRETTGMIDEESFNNIQLALDQIGDYDPVTLVLHSTGGQTIAGFKIADLLKKRQGPVQAIIPEEALSAATLIALSTQKIIMLNKSKVGPVEPQLFYGNEYVSSLDLLESVDPVIQSKGQRAINQAKEHLKILCGDLMPKTKLKKLTDRVLLTDSKHPSHASPIYQGELAQLGIPVISDHDLNVSALHSLYKKHSFTELDPSIIIEYTKDPIQNIETTENAENKLENCPSCGFFLIENDEGKTCPSCGLSY